MKKQVLVLALLFIGLTACDEEEAMTIDSSQPVGEFMASKSGEFVAQNDSGSQGEAAIGTDEDQTSFVRFNDSFNTALGTGTVTVFLSTSATFEADPMNGNPNLLLVGPVRDAGENFLKIPEGTSTDKYTHVILWCGSAAIPFGYAALQ